MHIPANLIVRLSLNGSLNTASVKDARRQIHQTDHGDDEYEHDFPTSQTTGRFVATPLVSPSLVVLGSVCSWSWDSGGQGLNQTGCVSG